MQIKILSDQRYFTIIFYSGIILFIAINIPMLVSYPYIMFDESALCRIAYFFQKDFTIHSDYILAQSSGAYWLPPIFYYVYGFFFYVFGFGIIQARLLSMLFGVVFLFLFKSLNKISGSSAFVLICSFIFLLIDPALLRASKLARPDMLAAMFLLASLIVLIKSEKKNTYLYIALSGISFASAVFTHPLSGLFLLAFFFVLYQKKSTFKYYLIFITPLCVCVCCWFLWILPHWNEAYPQILRNIAFRRSTDWKQPFIFFFQEYKSYPLSGFIHICSAVIGLTWLVKYKSRAYYLSFFVIFVFIFLRIFTRADSLIYLVACTPILFFSAIEKMNVVKKNLQWITFILILFGFFNASNNYYSLMSKSYPQTSSKDYFKFAQEVSLDLKINSHVLVYGLPDLSMALWQIRPDLHLTTFYWFGNQQAISHLDAIDCILHAQIGTARDKQLLFDTFWFSISDRIRMAKRNTFEPLIIGNEKNDWEYSARLLYLTPRTNK